MGMMVRFMVNWTDAARLCQCVRQRLMCSDYTLCCRGIVNGGILSTLLDCHGNWTAAIALMDRSCLPKPPLTLTASMLVSNSWGPLLMPATANWCHLQDKQLHATALQCMAEYSLCYLVRCPSRSPHRLTHSLSFAARWVWLQQCPSQPLVVQVLARAPAAVAVRIRASQ